MHSNKEIKWCYIESLNAVQQKDDLHLANKWKVRHINYQKSKMNVKLAAQTLSHSVADAIDFLKEDVKLPEFQGSEATTDFIRKIDTLFDLCNSRSAALLAKGTKKKINRDNLQEKWKPSNFSLLISLS
ncbi:THAP domain-containing protein 9-like protein [Elysia marginata]|uniref:THAP domain-containing protein 9-like protein n=1 Tax=Elysia marginata TaxID=1093978 RepID=A0AAV4HNC5_9GAST|nr:THAP domain-containing protein 9-like protein [Elysia marginata]